MLRAKLRRVKNEHFESILNNVLANTVVVQRSIEMKRLQKRIHY